MVTRFVAALCLKKVFYGNIFAMKCASWAFKRTTRKWIAGVESAGRERDEESALHSCDMGKLICICTQYHTSLRKNEWQVLLKKANAVVLEKVFRDLAGKKNVCPLTGSTLRPKVLPYTLNSAIVPTLGG